MLTRDELAMRLEAKHPSWYHRDIRDAIDVIVTHIAGSLALGQRVELRKIGSFSVGKLRARTGRTPDGPRNPIGREWITSERALVWFRAGVRMRRRLNPGATGSTYASQSTLGGRPRMKPGPKQGGGGKQARALRDHKFRCG